MSAAAEPARSAPRAVEISALTGARIRARRLDLGLKQAELARRVGISPSYLNLIEHNRRRIGGKLLAGLAAALQTRPAALSEGAEAGLMAALREAAQVPGAAAELDRAEEFAGRFPGWAALVAEQAARVARLERTVAALDDRLANDPALSEALHEVLSVVTAIRSTAGILAEGGEIGADWQRRFHRNLHEDSRRLADSAQALVDYLDRGQKGAGTAGQRLLPQEELEAWLAEAGHHLAALEGAPGAAPEAVAAEAGPVVSEAGRVRARAHAERYRRDAERLPLGALRADVAEGLDPVRIAARRGLDMATVLRRLATLPPGTLPAPLGLVSCDGAGAITFRKPVEGFALPRFGAGCPLWPLYMALAQPMTPVRAVLQMPATPPRRFLAYAIGQPSRPGGFDGPTVTEATMLVVPEGVAPFPPGPALEAGSACRVCPRGGCPARREPSVLGAA